MTTFFLYTFFVGFGLTVVSALLGAVDAGAGHAAHGHIEIGHGHGGLPHGHGGLPHGHGGLPHGHGAHLDNPQVYGDTGAVSPINFQSLVAFMMGFGAVGYLTTRFGLLVSLIALPVALLGGFGSGWLVYRWLRFLIRGERPLGPTSYVGVLGKLTVGIRAGGTGELVYPQHDSRKVLAARSVDPTRAIARGEQVVVLRYEKGIAYVQPWQEFKESEGM